MRKTSAIAASITNFIPKPRRGALDLIHFRIFRRERSLSSTVNCSMVIAIIICSTDIDHSDRMGAVSLLSEWYKYQEQGWLRGCAGTGSVVESNGQVGDRLVYELGSSSGGMA